MNSICGSCIKNDVCMFSDLIDSITDNDISDSPLNIECYARETKDDLYTELEHEMMVINQKDFETDDEDMW